jgi:hypothetical protein
MIRWSWWPRSNSSSGLRKHRHYDYINVDRDQRLSNIIAVGICPFCHGGIFFVLNIGFCSVLLSCCSKTNLNLAMIR